MVANRIVKVTIVTIRELVGESQEIFLLPFKAQLFPQKTTFPRTTASAVLSGLKSSLVYFLN